jgi:hypothetical protein
MKIYVILQAPNNGYRLVVEAASNKQFSLEDSGWKEIASGGWQQMLEFNKLEPDDKDIIWLRTAKSSIVTTYQMLDLMMDIDPDFMDDKEFI